MNNIIIGEKYFKYLNDTDFEVINIKKIYDDHIIVMKNNRENIVSYNDMKQYTLLKPNGYLFFTIVNMKESKDVVVYLVRNEDIKQKGIPYCACRQSITDIFSEKINDKSNLLYLGLSMSKDSCPVEVNYNMILGCDSVEYVEKVAYYIEDTLKYILSLLEKKYMFNKTLSYLYNNAIPGMIGLTKNLRDLLVNNEFMYDVHYGYEIHEVPFKLELVNDMELLTAQRLYLENDIKHEMFQTYVMKYDRTIELEKIQRKYVLIWDKDNKLYIVGYDEGKYINPAIKEQFKNVRDSVGFMKDYLRKVKE